MTPHLDAFKALPVTAKPVDQVEAEASYRDLLRQCYVLAGRDDATLEECTAVLAEVSRLSWALGQKRTAAIGKAESEKYWQETGRCPTCGDREPHHQHASFMPDPNDPANDLEPSPEGGGAHA